MPSKKEPAGADNPEQRHSLIFNLDDYTTDEDLTQSVDEMTDDERVFFSLCQNGSIQEDKECCVAKLGEVTPKVYDNTRDPSFGSRSFNDFVDRIDVEVFRSTSWRERCNCTTTGDCSTDRIGWSFFTVRVLPHAGTLPPEVWAGVDIWNFGLDKWGRDGGAYSRQTDPSVDRNDYRAFYKYINNPPRSIAQGRAWNRTYKTRVFDPQATLGVRLYDMRRQTPSDPTGYKLASAAIEFEFEPFGLNWLQCGHVWEIKMFLKPM